MIAMIWLICAAVLVYVFASKADDELYWRERRLDAEERVEAYKMWRAWEKRENERLLAALNEEPFYMRFFGKNKGKEDASDGIV